MLPVYAAALLMACDWIPRVCPALSDESRITSGITLLACVMPVATKVEGTEFWMLSARVTPPFSAETLVHVAKYEDGTDSIEVTYPVGGRIVDRFRETPVETCGEARARIRLISCRRTSRDHKRLARMVKDLREKSWPVPTSNSISVDASWWEMRVADRESSMGLDLIERSEQLRRKDRHPAALLVEQVIEHFRDCLARKQRELSPIK